MLQCIKIIKDKDTYIFKDSNSVKCRYWKLYTKKKQQPEILSEKGDQGQKKCSALCSIVKKE